MRRELINCTLENTDAQKIFLKLKGMPDEKEISNEVSMIETILNVQPPLKLLEIGCGSGRHSIEFAGRGYEVKGIDVQNTYDFAIAYNHTLGFMEEEELNTHLKNICKALKEGGKFLLKTPDPHIIPNMEVEKVQNWSEKDNKFILNEEYIKDGFKVKKCITMDIIKDEIIEYQEKQKAFSLNDVIDLLTNAGFSKIECYKGLDGSIATSEEFGVYVCRK